MFGCDAFHTLSHANLPVAQGSPYELVVVCNQPLWNGPLGDTLRTIFGQQVPYIDRQEPLFTVLRITEQSFTQLVVKHRNILKVAVDPSVKAAGVSVQYDAVAQPQIVLTLQGPTAQSLTDYVSENRDNLLYVLEQAERDRDISFAERFNEKFVGHEIRRIFGVDMNVPKGYVLAAQGDDFLWARYEYPQASQGFFLYSYPYTGARDLDAAALLAARNRFAARIPGPSDGSYMTTSEAFEPAYRMIRIEGRLWVEMRGFWDVAGDFMGGPYVSYTTVDTERGQVFTIDGYVYSPKLDKRNFVRGVEHLVYLISFPADAAAKAAAAEEAARIDAQRYGDGEEVDSVMVTVTAE